MALTPFFTRDRPLPERTLPRLRHRQHKIVLGSDFPKIPYTYATQLPALAEPGLGPDWLRAGLAACRVVGQPAAGAEPAGQRLASHSGRPWRG